MKIAFVYDVIYPFVKGGVEKRNFEFANALAKKHEVHLFGMKHWNGPAVVMQNNSTLHGVGKSMQLYSVNGKRKILPSIFFSVKLLPEIFKQDFDVVDCSEFPYFPVFVCKIYSVLKQKKVVYTWHEVWGKYWFEYLGAMGFFGYFAEKLALYCSDNVITVSEKTKRDLVNAGLGEKRITIIPNGIDFEELEKAKPSKECSEIVFAGRLAAHKNIDLLLNAMPLVLKELPKAKCIIIGNGPEKEKLESLILEKGLSRNCKILGKVESKKDFFGLLKSSKVFVSPSEREGFGITVIEAQAAALPVITLQHENNAAVDLVNNNIDGFLCKKDSADLAQKIVKLLKDNSLRKKFANRSKKKVEELSWKKLALLLEKNFEKPEAVA